MKIIFIGDLHGKSVWRKVAEMGADHIVFVGDYFDSFKLTHRQQIDEFKNIIYFAESNQDKVSLLLGNHDIHYILWHHSSFREVRGSGYSANLLYKVYSLYMDHQNLFSAAFQVDNILATHAGLSFNYYQKHIKEIHERFPEYNYAEMLNYLWRCKDSVLFNIGQSRGGPNEFGGPFWAHKDEVVDSPIYGLHQIIGHTHQDDITEIEGDNYKLTFIDVLDSCDKFYELNKE